MRKYKKIFLALVLLTNSYNIATADIVNLAENTIDIDVSRTIHLPENETYINNGTITSTLNTIMIQGSSNSTIINNGTMTGVAAAINHGTKGGAKAYLINNGLIERTNGGAAIQMSGPVVAVNETTGVIKTGSAGISMNHGSEFYNKGTIEATNVGVTTYNADKVYNSGMIKAKTAGMTTGYGDSEFVNEETGIIEADRGIYVRGATAKIDNRGKIIAKVAGIMSVADGTIYNSGNINVTKATVGSGILAGSVTASPKIYNSGTIVSNEYAIKMEGSEGILELGNGTSIVGKIEGTPGFENTLIMSGNVNVGTKGTANFGKLVVKGNTILDGNVYIQPSQNSLYYNSAIDPISKNIQDLSSDITIGELIVKGNVNVGVNYDGITDATYSSGKIIANSIVLDGGNVTLTNAGTTGNDIITESGKTNLGDQIEIKSIMLSNKKQAVNPSFQFELLDGLAPTEGWKSETVSKVEYGVTVLDQLYTYIGEALEEEEEEPPIIIVPEEGGEPVAPEEEEPPVVIIPEEGEEPIVPEEEIPTEEIEVPVEEIIPEGENLVTFPIEENGLEEATTVERVKRNAVPRTRAVLTNMGSLENTSRNFLNQKDEDMKVNDLAFSSEYVNGLKSDFTTENDYNYDYANTSNGVQQTLLYRPFDDIIVGVGVSYIRNKIEYSNNDKEKIDSFNINPFIRYTKENSFVDAHIGYGYNRHSLEVDWLGARKLESKYNSQILKSGVAVGHKRDLTSSINVTGRVGLDYAYVKEGTVKTPVLADIKSTSSNGTIGNISLSINETKGAFRWSVGAEYEYNFINTFNKNRQMINDYVMEELKYDRGTLSIGGNIGYQLTENFGINTGYKYSRSSNEHKNTVNAGFSLLF